MSKTIKVRMLVSRGNPTGGPILRAGAKVELPEFWAKRFVEDGAAEIIESARPKAEKPTAKTKKK